MSAQIVMIESRSDLFVIRTGSPDVRVGADCERVDSIMCRSGRSICAIELAAVVPHTFEEEL